MDRARGRRPPPSRLSHRHYADTGGLLKTGFVSFLLHITLAIVLILSTRSTIPKIGPSVYRVTVRSFSPQGDGTPLGSPNPGPGRAAELPASPPGEKLKAVANEKGTEKAEAAKSRQKKVEKKVENVEKGWSLEKRKSSLKSIQEAIEDIDKKAALEEIQKKVARRERSARLTQGLTISGAGAGTETGSGSGTGSGPAGSPSGGSPWGSSSGGSSALESRLSDYYSEIWAKIKKEWTLPGDLPKGKTSLETVIVITLNRDGKVQKSSFEKRSGNAHYDQSAMRAIKKAEPLPPIPKEFSDETFEIGIRFHPE